MKMQWLAAATAFTFAAGSAQAWTTVGDTNHPELLQSALTNAYNAGQDGVTINGGTYKLPANSANLTLSGMTRAFAINAYNVILQAPQNGVEVDYCTNLTVRGLTIAPYFPNGNQGRITAFGVDPHNAGVYLDVQCDPAILRRRAGVTTPL